MRAVGIALVFLCIAFFFAGLQSSHVGAVPVEPGEQRAALDFVPPTSTSTTTATYLPRIVPMFYRAPGIKQWMIGVVQDAAKRLYGQGYDTPCVTINVHLDPASDVAYASGGGGPGCEIGLSPDYLDRNDNPDDRAWHDANIRHEATHLFAMGHGHDYFFRQAWSSVMTPGYICVYAKQYVETDDSTWYPAIIHAD